MSEENVGVVRGSIEAFQGGDVPRSLSYLDPHVVLDSSRVGGPDVSYGHEEVARAVGRFMAAFDDYVYEIERLTDLGAGVILAASTETGRGRSSGVPVRRSFAFLYSVIDGKVARITVFPNEEQALEASGCGVR